MEIPYDKIEVEIHGIDDKTGKKIKVKRNVQEALDEIDDRIKVCYELLSCVEL